VLYLALHAAAATDRPYVATFLHVPLLPEQVIDNEPAAQRTASCPYMPLEMSIRGVEVLLTHAAAMGVAA
jgi:pyrrolidone-carboxylate peptidase